MKNILIKIIRFLIRNSIARKMSRLYNLALLPEFASVGRDTFISQPFNCEQPERVHFGSKCRIGKGCDFGIVKQGKNEGRIIIGNNVHITSRCQIFSIEKIEISDDVLIASNVFIVDCSHGYKTALEPYKVQSFGNIGSVEIGKGSWIGQNVVILQGVKIGEQCIIGANSVVSKSIPSKCIAVGSPAKVIKVWDESLSKWIRT